MFIMFRLPRVPTYRTPEVLDLPLAVVSLAFWNQASLARSRARGSATATSTSRRWMAMAFSFLSPMTQPGPLLAAMCPLSLRMPANRTRFSPAGPTQATLLARPGRPSSSLRASSVSQQSLPSRCSAGRSSTALSPMKRYCQRWAFPWMMRISYPARRRQDPQWPNVWAEQRPLVSGPMVLTQQRPEPQVVVPVSAPREKISSFSGAFQAVSGGSSSHRMRVPKPMPPRYFRAHPASFFSRVMVPVARSTRSTRGS